MSKSEPHTNKDDGTDQTNNFEFASDAVTDTDLTAFQTNLLFVIAGYHRGRYTDAQNQGDDGGVYGLAIKRTLESPAWYDEEIHHGRLYPNLDTLVDHDLVEKRERDKRTNTYHLTDNGWQLLGRRLQREIGCFRGDEDGGGE
jgi:hypothetical protein